MLREISDVIGGTYSLQKVFELVADRARHLIDAETVTIPIITPDQSTYTYRAAVGEHAEELIDVTLPLEIGVCGWVFRHRKPWWRGMLDQLDEHERNRWEKEAGTLILVPLVGKRQFLGGIAGINKKDRREFDRRDLDLLTLFASQVSIAIENAMIFEELAEAKQYAEAFRERLEETNQRLLQTNEELQHLALHDPLTRLPNRTLVTDRLHQGLLAAKRNEQPLALIMIDLDHFKEINDTLGHTIGDMLLISVGKRFQQVLREQDTLGRLGGDEFAVVLPQADRNDAIVVAQKLQAALEKPVTIEHNRFSIGASMGIALYPEHGSDPSGLLKGADVAMYVAKRNRDEYAFYNVEHDKYNPDRLELLRDLRIAIHKQHIGLAFQPKLDIRNGCISAIEALARWEHSDKGRIPPYDFIPTLEQTGLIKPFTLYILEQAVTQCKSWQDQGFDISVAVNLSMHNLRDIKLAPHILEILRRYDFPASKLTLEITESAIMNDPEYSLGVLAQLDNMGIQLSVDDFGTGYSSLSYLKRLPVKQLKIDRSFVTDMMQDQDNAMIVHSTIDLAHNLGLRTVAEGVESADVLDALQRMGCDIAQGYMISRPLPPEELLNFLHSCRWPTPRIQADRQGEAKAPGSC
ncbi:MAG: EAL domain-containing protein [Thiogranum sp.]|nr:EAL domain-containing protein [Thiogranum sp.]